MLSLKNNNDNKRIRKKYWVQDRNFYNEIVD